MKQINITSTQDWEEKRARTIGGTIASAIMGANKYITREQAKAHLLGEPGDNQDNAYMAYGRFEEPLIRAQFAHDHPGLKVVEPPKDNWLFVDEEKDYLTATPDGLLFDENGVLGVLEIKTRSTWNEGEVDDWAFNGIPQSYYIQTLHYCNVLNAKYVHYAIEFRIVQKGEVVKKILLYMHYSVEGKEKELKYLKSELINFYEKEIKGAN